MFVDNNLGSRPDYLRRLCRALRPLEKIWSAAVTIDVTDDPSLVREMALAGCTGVFVGFESLHNDNIADSRKKSPRTEDYARRVEVLHHHGIQVNGSFVLGFDHDRPDVFEKTAEWIEANRLECATFHILTPYPGTPLFAQMEAEGRLLHRDWTLYDTGHVVFRPKHMTPEQLAEGYAWCYRRLFSHALDLAAPAARTGGRCCPTWRCRTFTRRSNRLWHWLIRHRLTAAAWRRPGGVTRRRHVAFPAAAGSGDGRGGAGTGGVVRVARSVRGMAILAGSIAMRELSCEPSIQHAEFLGTGAVVEDDFETAPTTQRAA